MKYISKWIWIVSMLLIFALPVEAKELSMEEQILFDGSGVVISAVKIVDVYGGHSMHFLLENNTDQDLTFKMDRSSIDGMMFDIYMKETVQAHDSVTAKVEFDDIELSLFDIFSLEKIETRFLVYSDDPEEPEIITDMISINTSASEASQQEHNDAGVLLLDQDGIQIIEKELSTNEYGVFQYILIKNETQSNIHAYVHHMRINGNEVGGTLDFGVITPEKRAKKALGFMNSDLNKAGIKTVQTIEASVRFVDDDTHTMLLEDIDIVIGEGTETKVIGTDKILSEETIYTDDYVEVSFENLHPSSIQDTTLDMHIKNVRGYELVYSFSNVWVNGKKVDGYSGTNYDYLISIEPGETYDTTVGLRADSLRENGISKIQDISIELSFVSTKMDVHDVTVDVPLQENSSVENSLVQISNNTNDYAHKMYYFTNDKYLCVFYELHNPNDVSVQLKGTIKFKDEDGNVIDTATDTLQYILPDKYGFMVFVSEKKEATDTSLSVIPSLITEEEKADVSWDIKDLENGGVQISATNKGNENAVVQLTVIFAKNGNVSASRRGFGEGPLQTIAPGETMTREITDLTYDNRYVYVSALKE